MSAVARGVTMEVPVLGNVMLGSSALSYSAKGVPFLAASPPTGAMRAVSSDDVQAHVQRVQDARGEARTGRTPTPEHTAATNIDALRKSALPFGSQAARPAVDAAPQARPQEPPAARGGEQKELESYAYLCATCAVFPEQVAATHQRFGIHDAAARSTLDTYWAERFAADLGLRQRFGALCTHFANYLRQRGG